MQALPGDFNQDGIVDAADYTVWRNSLGQTVENKGDGADADGDMTIDEDDYLIWKLNYGATAPGSGSIAIASESESAITAEIPLAVANLTHKSDVLDRGFADHSTEFNARAASNLLIAVLYHHQQNQAGAASSLEMSQVEEQSDDIPFFGPGIDMLALKLSALP